MLILILVDIQYLQNVVFSFEQGSNGQNHFLSDSHSLDRKILPEQHFPFSLPLRGGWGGGGDFLPFKFGAITYPATETN